MSSPILDLSYRNYDGPLAEPRHRWWAIAKTTMRIALKKRIMWVFMALSAWYYFAMIFVLFIVDQFAQQAAGQGGPNPISNYVQTLVWKDQFVHGFSYGQIMYLAVGLIVGAGTIANDNRANALLVYLSKPVSKADYIWGKWFGVFVPVTLTMAIPSLIFYLYCLMSYREQGFLSDPWLFFKLLLVYPVAGAFQASLIIGVSSFFNQGRMAGAAYAGLYFLTNFFTHLMGLTYVGMSGGFDRGRRELTENAFTELVQRLFYSSVDGTSIGWMKSVLNTAGSVPFGLQVRGGIFIKAPPLWVPLLAMLLFGGIAMLIAWKRIRAVEVVG